MKDVEADAQSAPWNSAKSPAEAGFGEEAFQAALRWHAEHPLAPRHGLIVLKGASLVAESYGGGLASGDRGCQFSLSKSVYSCALAIAVEDGKIGSIDDPIVDYYPEMLDVAEGEGPKPDRFARPKDRFITFRQAIGNTSGYLKPGEYPGQIFNYQTFAMNILTHAIAKQYGLYDSVNPTGSLGIGALIQSRIRDPIGGTWTYEFYNFPGLDLAKKRQLGVYGFTTFLYSTTRDMARLGLFWLQRGRWNDDQVIPQGWIDMATGVSDMLLHNENWENQVYGLGFWSNGTGALWPDLPRDSYAAVGNGGQYVWVCPSLDLVIAISYRELARLENMAAHLNESVVRRIVEAVE